MWQDNRERAQYIGNQLAEHGIAGAAEAQGDLIWAVFNLGAAAVGGRIVEELTVGEQSSQRLQALLGVDWDVLEVTAMSLVFGDVMTALDLCADAVMVTNGHARPKSGAFFGVRDLKKLVQEKRPGPILNWTVELLQSPKLTLLKQSRDALTHRHVRRHIALTLGSNVSRSLVEITDGDGVPLGDIGSLSVDFLAFGGDRLSALCDALEAAFLSDRPQIL